MAKKDNPTPKKKAGQPTKYKPEYCEQVVAFMAQGFSVEAFAGHVWVSKDTLYEWMERYPEFKEAVAIGRERSRVWWEEAARAGLMTEKGTSFSAATWIFNMRNRFGWRNEDKVEHTGQVDASMVIKNGDPDAV